MTAGSCSAAERDKEDLLGKEHHLLGMELSRFAVDKAFRRWQETALLVAGRALAAGHKRIQYFRLDKEQFPAENAGSAIHYCPASA